MSTEFYWIAVAAVIVLSSARITRLFVYDDFPPVVWVRKRLKANEPHQVMDHEHPWKLLLGCGFCMSFWVTVSIIVTGDLSGVFDHEPLAPWMTPAWWFVFGTFAASYLAASYVARDGDDS